MFTHAHIMPHINYASNVWDGTSENNLKKLISLHRRSAKLVLRNENISTDNKLLKLNILPLIASAYLTRQFWCLRFTATKHHLQFLRYSQNQLTDMDPKISFYPKHASIFVRLSFLSQVLLFGMVFLYQLSSVHLHHVERTDTAPETSIYLE